MKLWRSTQQPYPEARAVGVSRRAGRWSRSKQFLAFSFTGTWDFGFGGKPPATSALASVPASLRSKLEKPACGS